uniref:Gastrin/cholecystokinin peptide hormone domain-containing protein n=1 Tax=Branchiostoma floridae TaxID=7739 RepID=C3Z915_BRAFL|eukprot:XP_002594916.1 hypothetical protein BRAFLDRAFT_72297 [Branchiostoma floridae]
MSQMGALKTIASVVCLSAILILLIKPAIAGSSFTTNPDIFEEDPSRRTLPPLADWETAIADLVSRYRHLILEILGDTSSSPAAQERRSTVPSAHPGVFTAGGGDRQGRPTQRQPAAYSYWDDGRTMKNAAYD